MNLQQAVAEYVAVFAHKFFVFVFSRMRPKIEHPAISKWFRVVLPLPPRSANVPPQNKIPDTFIIVITFSFQLNSLSWELLPSAAAFWP